MELGTQLQIPAFERAFCHARNVGKSAEVFNFVFLRR